MMGYENEIKCIQNANESGSLDAAEQSLGYLCDFYDKSGFASNDSKLTDTVQIGKEIISYHNHLKQLKEILVYGNNRDYRSVAENLTNSQKHFVDMRVAYAENYQFVIDSTESLNKAIIQSMDDYSDFLLSEVEKIKTQAEEIAHTYATTEINKGDLNTDIYNLPEEIIVGRYPVQEQSCELLRAIGYDISYQDIKANLKQQGNILLNTDYNHKDDPNIDGFIISYIFKYLQLFPVGTVNIHIFDSNTNYLYKRLANVFQSEQFGDRTKKTVQIHADLNDLHSLRDVTCEDIFKKTSTDKPDLYSLYTTDQSDAFNLVIIRDGLLDSTGYGSNDVLEIINSMSKSDDIGHICGVRFLIVDYSDSFENELNANKVHLINLIKQNCEIEINYSGFQFYSKAGSMEVLHINGDLDTFIQSTGQFIAEAINKKNNDVVKVEDLFINRNDETPGNILYIPVGKSGGNVAELPFSCKDEGESVAGQCIGYMVIGQSGSGKSSFFHSLVLNGCMKYSPDDLQFWLLDFKNGGASSKYGDCGLPHIKIIAENNKIDDALCLFQMILEEMERRSKAFNKCFTDNIIEYNKLARKEGLEYFPRIIVAIDEVQEIFRDENANQIKNLISSISSRMRSAGMHFVMLAQNLSDGKSMMLRDAFMNSASGRVSFRISEDALRDSGFGEDFNKRLNEINTLRTGEAFVSYGKDSIKKVRIAYASPNEMSERLFGEIRNRYTDYLYLKPKVIGSKARLSLLSSRQGIQGNYLNEIENLKEQNGNLLALLGEDVYRMEPMYVRFSQHENSSVLLFGSDKLMASSLCTSIAVSLCRQNATVHLFNGDRTRISEGNEAYQHPFMYLCQNIAAFSSTIKSYRLDELRNVMSDIYSEYKLRQSVVQKADYEEPLFAPIVMIVNDLFGIESFIANDSIDLKTQSVEETNGSSKFPRYEYNIPTGSGHQRMAGGSHSNETLQSVMNSLVKNGYRYNIHVVLAIRGDLSAWRDLRSVSSVNSNNIVFNDTEYASQIETNTYYIKEMLKNISNEGEGETLAVWTNRRVFSKLRPIIYNMSNTRESDALNDLLEK